MTVTIQTKRLILRPLTVNDAPQMFHHWANSKMVTKYLTWPPHTSITQTQARLALREKSDDEDWGIVIQATDELIGTINVVEDKPEIKTKIIGYVIGEAYWGEGYMTEALDAVINYLFSHTTVNRIEASHDIENPGSGKVMQKNGMTFEGILRQAGRNNRGIVDIALYSRLRED